MKNVTISSKDELASRARVAAARQGLSVSRFIRNMLEKNLAERKVKIPNPENPQTQGFINRGGVFDC